MKKLVVYYSYSGRTRKIAEGLAKKENAELIEVKEKKKRSIFNALLFGSIAAGGRKKSEIVPLACDFSIYETITILMPIWAGHPAPVMNNVIDMLPNDKEVELVLTSGSGNSSKSAEQTKALITAKGCKVVKYTDIKA